MNEHDIAIVGMGCVFPSASGLDQYWSNNVNGVDAIREIPPGRLNGALNQLLVDDPVRYMTCSRGGFIPESYRFDPLKLGVLPKNVHDGDPDQFLALAVIADALTDAGIASDSPLRERCDLIIGRGGYPTNKMCEGYFHVDLFPHLMAFLAKKFPDWTKSQLAQLAEEMSAAMPPNGGADSSATGMPNLVAGRAANRLNLRGTSYLVDAACASSLVALDQAVARLRMRKSEVGVVCGIHLFQTPTFWYVFQQIGALSPSNQIRPFHRHADGLLAGEGAGAVVLKRAADAIAHGDRIYAWIKGIGTASDGREVSLMSPAMSGQLQSLRNAYSDAGVHPDSISYLEGHGTATPVGDAVELSTIQSFYGTRTSGLPQRAMGSVKSMIGHTMPAAGMASLIRVALALSNKVLPPSLHCEEPHQDLEHLPFYLNGEARAWTHPSRQGPRRAGINAFGFGGINAHTILEEVVESASIPIRPRPFVDQVIRASELLVFAGSSRQHLCEQMANLAEKLSLEQAVGCLARLAAETCSQVDQQPYRLALVCDHVRHAQELLAVCRERLEAEEHPSFRDIEAVSYRCVDVNHQPTVAAVFPGTAFPGLSGNYSQHLMALCLHYPELRKQMDVWELRNEHPQDLFPTSLILAPPTTFSPEVRESLNQRLASPTVSTEATGSSSAGTPTLANLSLGGITVGNWLSWKLIEFLGIPVSMFMGQSQGELAALCAAGAMDIDELMPGLWDALTEQGDLRSDSRSAFVLATEDRLAEVLAELPGTTISIHVAPNAQAVGGPAEEIDGLVQRCRELGIAATKLPFPAVHTPHQSYVAHELKAIWERPYRFSTPRKPTYSAITESLFPVAPAEVRQTAMSNLDHAVRYWQTLKRMYDDGANVFVQVGNGGMASTFRNVLPGDDAVLESLDVDDRDPLTQLHRLCATLFVSGVRFDLPALHRYRQTFMATPVQPAIPERTLLMPLRLDVYPFGKELAEWACQHARDTAGVPSVMTTQQMDPAESEARNHSELAFDETVSAMLVPASGHLPLVGHVVAWTEGESIVTERVYDLDEDYFLHDHVFINAQQHKPLESCLPLLPMAVMVEALAETASCLAPGLALIGVERMRALRWAAMRDSRQLPVRIEAKVAVVDESAGVVTVRAEMFSNGESNSSAEFRFGSVYEQQLEMAFSERDESDHWIFGVEEIYRDRHSFNGPRLQCIAGLDRVGPTGGDAELVVLPWGEWFRSIPNPQFLLDPVILDGIAQLLGLWVRGQGRYALPTGFRKLELYRPTPSHGTRVRTRIESVTARNAAKVVTTDVEVQDGSGRVWMRIQGFSQWIFDWTIRGIEAQRDPVNNYISHDLDLADELQDTVVTWVSQEEVPGGNFDWMARLCLNSEEEAIFARLETPRRRWQWLWGRLAAKDAVRKWLARFCDTVVLHPLDISILNDESGQPYAVMRDVSIIPPQLSISHTEDRAFAAASNYPIGVDIEPLNRDIEEIIPHFTTAEEREMVGVGLAEVHEAGDATRHNDWLSLWCAKEAVGKALGTGLAGRPLDFEALDVDRRHILIHHHPTGQRFVVHVMCTDNMLVAFASIHLSSVAVES